MPRWLGYPRLSLLLLLLVRPVDAAEVDTFTWRERALSDAYATLNREVNRRLQYALRRANGQARMLADRRHSKTRRPVFASQQGLTYCNVDYLYDAVSDFLGGALIGELEQWAEESVELDRLTVPFEASIYQDFLFDETPSITGSKRVASVLNVQGVRMGTDKLGHFFTEGRSYFEKYQVGLSFADVLLFGEQTEILFFGSLTTGVYSFADLAANMNGFRFWNALLAQSSDPMSHESVAPYMVCHEQAWQQVRAFEFRDYVDVAWDESLNCNQFRNSDLLGKMLQRMDADVYCQLSAEQVTALRAKYGDLYAHIVNPKGLIVMPQSQQAYALLDEYIHSERGQRKPRWMISILLKFRDRLKRFVDNVPFPY